MMLADVFLALIARALGGCVYSIHRLDDGTNGVVDSGLAGRWGTQDEAGKQPSMTIRALKQAYEVDFTDPDKNRTLRYEANLVRIDKWVFADLRLDGEVEADGSTQDLPFGALAVHMFLKVSVEGDTLKMWTMSHDWLRVQFIEKKITLAHDDLDIFTILLTAPTPQLQDFLRKAATTSDAFGEPFIFTRKK